MYKVCLINKNIFVVFRVFLYLIYDIFLYNPHWMYLHKFRQELFEIFNLMSVIHLKLK